MVNILGDLLVQTGQQVAWTLIAGLPGLILAVLILVVGYVLGALLGWGLEALLHRTKACDVFFRKTNLKRLIGKCDLEHFLGVILKWYVFVWALPLAATQVQWVGLARFLEDVAFWAPQAIIAVLIGLAGFVLAEYVHDKISTIKTKGALLVADVSRIIVLVFTLLIALRQIGLQVFLAENVFLIVLGAIALGLAIAFGVGYGLALQDSAKEDIKRLRKL
ncbi:hypothetical protein HZB02_04030 [Candidatus Woesearchaeota archaeon]|nr:hypothetical protein [Candidatus Woesearchaeota archaeon]